MDFKDSIGLRFIDNKSLTNNSEIIAMAGNDIKRSNLFGKLPLSSELWQQFYIDSVSFENNNDLTHFTVLKTYFSELAGTDLPSQILSLRLNQKGLVFDFTPSKDTATHKSFLYNSSFSKPLRIECGYLFHSNESLSFELHINGKHELSKMLPINFSADFFMSQIVNHINNRSNLAKAHIGGFAVSTNRNIDIPTIPTGIYDSIVANRLFIKNSAWDGRLDKKTIKAVRVRLFDMADTATPIYDNIYTDPFFFSRFVEIPFPLDTGNYCFDLSYKNTFDRWGHFSAKKFVTIDSIAKAKYNLINFSIGKSKYLKSGKWYKAELNLRGSLPDDFSYFIANLHHHSYTLGHPGNKGGPYYSSTNYSFNLSFTKDSIIAFERIEEGTMRSKRVGKKGVYTDIRSARIIEKAGVTTIKFSARLLNNALPGEWKLGAWFIDPDGIVSNVHRKNIIVEETKLAWNGKKTKLTIVIALAAILVITAIYLKFFRFGDGSHKDRGGNEKWKPDSRYSEIVNYINEHIKEEITVTTIRQHLGISERKFHGLLKKNSPYSFSQLINKIRVEKAAGMLLTQEEKNITEVGYEAGFNDSAYFSRIFKKEKGVSPREFRESERKKIDSGL